MVPEQVVDRTKGVRPWTFFEKGVVGHVPFGDPFDKQLSKLVCSVGHKVLEQRGGSFHVGGTLVCMGKFL